MQLFKTMRELIDFAAQSYTDRIAFVVKNGENNYRNILFPEFCDEVKSIAAALTQKGYTRGDRIGVIGSNCYEWITVHLGILCAGCVSVPLDNRLFPEEIERLIERSHAKAFFYTKNHTNTLSKFPEIEIFALNGEERENGYAALLAQGKSALNADNTAYRITEIDEKEMGILLFTSGTTAESKGVMLSQYNVLTNVQDLSDVLDFTAQHTYASLIPLHHVFGCTAATLFVANGVKTVFVEGLRVAKCLTEYNVTMLVGVPAIFNAVKKTVLKEAEKKGKLKSLQFGLKLCAFLRKLGIDVRRKLFSDVHAGLGGNLRLIISGAAALDPEISDFFNGIGIDLIQGYGLTETAPVISAERPNRIRRGSIGHPMTHVQVKIDNPDENGIGEICAKGPNIMLGYYENEQATAEVMEDNWFHTGDMGYMDKEGFIFITGRKKSVIVLKNGKNVFPEELEQLIGAIHGVTECLVFLRKDSADKERLGVKIVYDKEVFDSDESAKKALEEDVKAINTNLVNYKHILDVLVTSTPMEKTTTAKIKRNKELEKLQ